MPRAAYVPAGRSLRDGRRRLSGPRRDPLKTGDTHLCARTLRRAPLERAPVALSFLSASALPAAVTLRRSLRACSLLRPPTLYLIRWEKSNLPWDADASSVNRTASAIASPVTCPSPPGACFTGRKDLVLVLGAVGVSFRGRRRTCPCLPEPCPVRLSRLARRELAASAPSSGV